MVVAEEVTGLGADVDDVVAGVVIKGVALGDELRGDRGGGGGISSFMTGWRLLVVI